MGYCIEHLPSRISIGRETETGVTDIRIDCTDWLEKWPGMAISAMYRPPNGEPYIVLTEMIGNSLVWHVSDADTAAAGTGRLELTGIAEGKRKLSALVDVQVARRLEGAAGPMPEAAKPWADEVMAAAATVEQSAKEAKAAAVSAGEHAASAGEAAATAETEAATAQAAAESAQAAEAKAQSAADRAEAAAGSGSGGVKVQADWDQNDETAANYIKGRPCYETDPKMEYLIKDETVTLETVEGAPGDWALAELATNISLEVGKTYTVTWDGKEYSVVGTAFEQMAIIIGNMLLVGGDDTGEPFSIGFVGPHFFIYGLGAGSHTFSVATMVPRQIIPLPSKFLPDIPAEKLPDIPAEKLPEIPAAKLPDIPAEKLPDVLKTNDLFVELVDFDFGSLTQNTQPLFRFSNVTYAELLEAAKKSRVILKDAGRDFYVKPNNIQCDSNGNIFIENVFYYASNINAVELACTANTTMFYRNNWHKVATE